MMILPYSQEPYSLSSSDTTSLSLGNMEVASAIVQTDNSCSIRKGTLIPRGSSKRSAKVLRPFSIQLLSAEYGYVAISSISYIYELEATKSSAVRSYLYSLVDELVWLEEQKESLADGLLAELEQLKTYLELV